MDLSHSFLGAMPWSDREAFLLQDSHTSYSAGFKGLLGVAALQTSRVGFDPVRRLFAWDTKIPRSASASAPRLAVISSPESSVLCSMDHEIPLHEYSQVFFPRTCRWHSPWSWSVRDADNVIYSGFAGVRYLFCAVPRCVRLLRWDVACVRKQNGLILGSALILLPQSVSGPGRCAKYRD